jgi:hypothetical protein
MLVTGGNYLSYEAVFEAFESLRFIRYFGFSEDGGLDMNPPAVGLMFGRPTDL